MSLKEIDGDVFIDGVEYGGNLLDAILEVSEELKKPQEKIL